MAVREANPRVRDKVAELAELHLAVLPTNKAKTELTADICPWGEELQAGQSAEQSMVTVAMPKLSEIMGLEKQVVSTLYIFTRSK